MYHENIEDNLQDPHPEDFRRGLDLAEEELEGVCCHSL